MESEILAAVIYILVRQADFDIIAYDLKQCKKSQGNKTNVMSKIINIHVP